MALFNLLALPVILPVTLPCRSPTNVPPKKVVAYTPANLLEFVPTVLMFDADGGTIAPAVLPTVSVPSMVVLLPTLSCFAIPTPPLTVSAPAAALMLSNSLLTVSLPLVSNAASSPSSTPMLTLPLMSSFSSGPRLLIPRFPLLAMRTTGFLVTGVLISIVPAPLNSSIPLDPSTSILKVFIVPTSSPLFGSLIELLKICVPAAESFLAKSLTKIVPAMFDVSSGLRLSLSAVLASPAILAF